MSYEQYEYQDGDVVYCDIPYENKDPKTGAFRNCDDYGTNKSFNNLEFYKWVKTRPYQVFFSSYEISDNSFYKIKIKTMSQLMNNKGDKRSTCTEYLYSNKPIDISHLISGDAE